MAKKRPNKGPDRTKQAAARVNKKRSSLEFDLLRVGRALADLTEQRRPLIEQRDKVVAQLLSAGCSMTEAARLAGTSRQALMKRTKDE